MLLDVGVSISDWEARMLMMVDDCLLVNGLDEASWSRSPSGSSSMNSVDV